jgi:flagellar protein FlaF
MSHAARAYAQNATAGLSGRALEAAVLNRCATELHRAAAALPDDTAPLIEALERNRRAWRLFVDEIRDEECPLPAELRRSLLGMAGFVFSRTVDLTETPDPARVAPLVEINRALAAGLEAR